jgi:hypothetical protein
MGFWNAGYNSGFTRSTRYAGKTLKAAALQALASGYYNGVKRASRQRLSYAKAVMGRTQKGRNPRPLPKSKRGFRSYQGIEEGHTISSSKSSVYKKPTQAEMLLKGSLPQIVRAVSQTFHSSSEGQQSFLNTSNIWSWNDLITYGPNVSTTSEHRFFVEGGTIKLVYTNFTSTPVTLTLYNYQFKKDVTSLTVENIIQNGLSAKYNSTSEWTVPMMNPSESAEFRNNIKVLDTKKITLSPGETHIHSFYVKIEKYFTSNKFSNISPLPSYIAKITHGVLARLQGTPVTDDTKISYAATKIGCIIHTTLNYKTPQGNVGSQLTAVQSSVPQNALASEKYMNEDTGLATVNTGA